MANSIGIRDLSPPIQLNLYISNSQTVEFSAQNYFRTHKSKGMCAEPANIRGTIIIAHYSYHCGLFMLLLAGEVQHLNN